MKRDPRVRKDGLCFVCLKPRVVPSTRQKGVPVEVYLSDPFCSSTCSRSYHENPLPKMMQSTS